MKFSTEVKLAISRFFRKYGMTILVIVFAWFIVFSINKYMKAHPKEKKLIQSYNANTPVMDETDDLSSSEAQTNNSLIDTYFNYCNSKDYDDAYNMLSNSCKDFIFGNSVDNFKKYIDEIFTHDKKYYIQNYSNVDNVYIYVYTVIDDIEATGTTGGYDSYSERIAIFKENGDYKISCDNYIGTFDVYKEAEDTNLKATITTKNVSYTREGYNVTLENKGNYYLLISSGTDSDEVQIEQSDSDISMSNGNIYCLLYPNSKEDVQFLFDKFFDDTDKETKLKFNTIRVYQDLKSDPIRTYSLNIDLK